MLLALPSIVAAACTPKAPPPLRVTPAAFSAVQRVCMLPLDSKVDDPPGVERFEAMLLEGLRRRGFEPIDAARTRAAIEAFAQEEGGLYDPYTGEARDAAVFTRVHRRLADSPGCQAIVTPRIVYVMATWQGDLFSTGTAFWDGVEQELDAGRNASGRIGAISLQVRIADLDDRDLYFGVGGIRVAHRLEEHFFSSEFVPVPPAELLTDEGRNRRAIDLALRQVRKAP
jgi:hypothetical protein